MSILIKGMEMPKSRGEYELRMYVDSDGTATVEGSYCRFEGEPFEAVPVPPHGRCIDADEVIGHLFNGEQCLYSWDEIEEAVDATSTIIEEER